MMNVFFEDFLRILGFSNVCAVLLRLTNPAGKK